MKGRPKKSSREKDLTSRYLRGDLDQDHVEQHNRFTTRSRRDQELKTQRTTQMRAEESAQIEDLDSLPVGQVIQVFSLFSEVLHDEKTYLCVTRKTLQKTRDTQIVVGDQVRFRPAPPPSTPTPPPSLAPRPLPLAPSAQDAVIEQILPRRTVVTRADSFKQLEQHPIVANADQMLIVASLLEPRIKWGLIDRMVLAAHAGGLRPVICLNKLDLVEKEKRGPEALAEAREVLAYLQTQNVATLETSVQSRTGLDTLQSLLANQTTVLAGHSGVGKSSLIRALVPSLDLRVGAISGYTGKGRHTTTSARRYPLPFGGHVVDTPGVKLFGLWNITPDNLDEYFPDVATGTAPEWRVESYQRILESLR